MVPSFTERPSGRRRAFSMTGTEFGAYGYNGEVATDRGVGGGRGMGKEE